MPGHGAMVLTPGLAHNFIRVRDNGHATPRSIYRRLSQKLYSSIRPEKVLNCKIFD